MKTWCATAAGVILMAVGGLAAGAAQAADPPSQYKAQDVVAAYAKSAGDSGARCAAGTVADPAGGCDPLVKTRGFSLAAPTTARTAAGAGGAHHHAATRAAPGPVAHVSYRPSAPLQAHATPGDLLITFRLGSADLTPQARSNARAFAEALQSPQLADAHFAIGGHTDVSGAPARNKTLSAERAQAVKAFLVAQGVAADRLEATGYGSERLADPKHPRSAANRRVEALRLN